MSIQEYKKTKTILLATDGATGDKNPGPITLGGLLVKDNGEVVTSFCKRKNLLDTNNVAEYYALIHGLELAAELGFKRISCFVDSQLVSRQITGEYACRKSTLKPLLRQVLSLMNSAFDYCDISWHRRDTALAMAADKCSKGGNVNNEIIELRLEFNE